MKKRASSETITGVLKQLLFSPKGTIEGLLLALEGETIQMSMRKLFDGRGSRLNEGLPSTGSGTL
ncbi:MAG: hypothetical protein ACRD3Q_03810 [Terriglobales bacterium]